MTQIVAETSPGPDPLLRREVQLLAGLHVERRVPLVDVADRVGAELPGGVAVGHERIAQRLGAELRAPYLREGEKEALVAGQAVGRRRGFAGIRAAVTVVRRGEAGNVGDVFAQRQL